VKRYSSGMYCRLAFAVAAFLDPEILIVDEVLAVGDAGFQRKSLGRLNDATDREGRTVLFVSHNFEAIRTFCRRVIVLDHGKIIFDGGTQEGLEMYLRAQPKVVDVRAAAVKNRLNRSTGNVLFSELVATDSQFRPTWKFAVGETVRLSLRYTVEKAVDDLMFLMTVYDAADSKCVTVIKEDVSRTPLSQGHDGVIDLEIPKLALRPGEYGLRLDLRSGDNRFGHDVLDSNVGLPFLVVSSDETDQYLRMGQITIDYQMKLTEGHL
jgi:lipopolysaccharide transport system ATP-binding protein